MTCYKSDGRITCGAACKAGFSRLYAGPDCYVLGVFAIRVRRDLLNSFVSYNFRTLQKKTGPLGHAESRRRTI